MLLLLESLDDLILASVYAPCILVLDGIECIGKDTESGKADHRVCNALQEAVDCLVGEKYPVIVVASTTLMSSVVSKLRSQFLHKVWGLFSPLLSTKVTDQFSECHICD